MPIFVFFGPRQPGNDPKGVSQNRPGNLALPVVKTLTPQRLPQEVVLEDSDSALALAASVLKLAKTLLFYAFTHCRRALGTNRIVSFRVPGIAVLWTVKTPVANDGIGQPAKRLIETGKASLQQFAIGLIFLQQTPVYDHTIMLFGQKERIAELNLRP